MTNERWTVFAVKSGDGANNEILWVDTADRNKAYKAIESAPSLGYEITRIYKPETDIAGLSSFANKKIVRI